MNEFNKKEILNKALKENDINDLMMYETNIYHLLRIQIKNHGEKRCLREFATREIFTNQKALNHIIRNVLPRDDEGNIRKLSQEESQFIDTLIKE